MAAPAFAWGLRLWWVVAGLADGCGMWRLGVQIKVVASQFGPTKGDYDGNLATLGDLIAQLELTERLPDLLVLPETALTGYFVEGGVM